MLFTGHRTADTTVAGIRCIDETRYFYISVRTSTFRQRQQKKVRKLLGEAKGGYKLVTLPRIVTSYRDSVDGTRDSVTYQKLVTR